MVNKGLLPDDPHTNSIRDRWNAALKNLRLVHNHAARKYNRTRKPPPFQVGDHVWFRNFSISKANRHFAAKLSPRYKGPYILAEFTTPVSVKLIDAAAGNTNRAHVSQLQLA
jgi:hypothetical protein